jgi:hypothetical protein
MRSPKKEKNPPEDPELVPLVVPLDPPLVVPLDPPLVVPLDPPLVVPLEPLPLVVPLDPPSVPLDPPLVVPVEPLPLVVPLDPPLVVPLDPLPLVVPLDPPSVPLDPPLVVALVSANDEGGSEGWYSARPHTASPPTNSTAPPLRLVVAHNDCIGDGPSENASTAEILRMGTRHRLQIGTKSSKFDANDRPVSLNQVIPYDPGQNRASTVPVTR